MISVKDKVVIVTGAGQGIGRVYAETLASEGAKLVIAEINTINGEEVANLINKNGGDGIFIVTDVAKFDTVQGMVEKTLTKYGRIDALVNNAAIYYGLTPARFMDISEEQWDIVMQVNIKGVWNCARAVAPQMIKQGKGKIINIASSVAFEGSRMFMHYVASKGAIVSMTRSMANELAELGGPGITVNTLSPGAIAGEASIKIGEGMRNIPNRTAAGKGGPIEGQMLKRRGNAEDMAGAVLYMVSDASDFMTASIIVVDGGSSMY
ncbi:MAG: SDR family oxidoreductase [Chloroflexi bacterium]|nr:SDR family oxidoreductase [Chloroflexota bacterium]